MIKFIIIVSILLNYANAQIPAQIDSINKKRVDSLYELRNNYINFPLSRLINDINLPIDFGMPDALGRKKFGTSYYKHFYLDLPFEIGIPIRGFEITIVNKYIVSVPEYYRLKGQAWNDKMKLELGTQIVTSIKKY